MNVRRQTVVWVAFFCLNLHVGGACEVDQRAVKSNAIDAKLFYWTITRGYPNFCSDFPPESTNLRTKYFPFLKKQRIMITLPSERVNYTNSLRTRRHTVFILSILKCSAFILTDIMYCLLKHFETNQLTCESHGTLKIYTSSTLIFAENCST